jgi:hypothetical protein
MWEVISAIAGTVSAFCDIRAAGTSETSTQDRPAPPSTRPPKNVRKLLIRSAGWCLGYWSFLWITQPYGVFITDRERTEMLGWFIAGPAFLILLAGLEPSATGESRPGSSPDEKE